MASCEPYCSSAYSEELHWRMVWLCVVCDGLGYTYTRSAESLKLTKVINIRQVR